MGLVGADLAERLAHLPLHDDDSDSEERRSGASRKEALESGNAQHSAHAVLLSETVKDDHRQW